MSDRTPKKGRGCLFYGCLTTILVFIGVVLGIYFGVRTAVRTGITSYTSTSPAEIPRLQLSAAEQSRIAKELEQRTGAAGRSGQPVVLDENELNVLLSQTSELQTFRDQVYLRPVGNQLQAHLSLPLDQFPLWKEFLGRLRAKDLEGRYFNGVAMVEPAVTNGALSLTIQDLLVNGKSLPEDFTTRIKKFDLAAQARTNSTAQALFSQIESVEVRDGRVIVKPAGR